MLDELRREARAGVDELAARVRRRNALKAELGVGPRPHKYLIVATGNIYDDVEQARAAAQAGADVIAVIRSTAQSLLDYVPHGATTEGYGGTYATQENFRIMREALDDESRRLGRYVHLTNYSSGLCMPEIAFAAAWERLDMLLNDAMYGILFRDINMKRTLCDQHFSRRICALAGIVINTGEDNYITTADADEAAHTVIASQFVNESFAHRAGLPDRLIGLGHRFEIDPAREDTVARELAQALLVRTLFPDAPIKYMPPTKHKQGDIFFSHAYDVMADVVALGDGAGDPAPRHDDRGDAQPLPHGPLRGAEERRLRLPGLALDGRGDHLAAGRHGASGARARRSARRWRCSRRWPRDGLMRRHRQGALRRRGARGGRRQGARRRGRARGPGTSTRSSRLMEGR